MLSLPDYRIIAGDGLWLLSAHLQCGVCVRAARWASSLLKNTKSSPSFWLARIWCVLVICLQYFNLLETFSTIHRCFPRAARCQILLLSFALTFRHPFFSLPLPSHLLRLRVSSYRMHACLITVH